MSLLIRNAAFIATMDAKNRELRGEDILTKGPKIVEIGPSLTAPPGTEVVDASNHWVFPGLINTHHHLCHTLTRCLNQTQPLELLPWLKFNYHIWSGLTPDSVYAGALVGLGELLKSGCTTVCDHHYVFPRGQSLGLIDREIQAAAELGIRFHPCRGSISLGVRRGGLSPDILVQSEEEILVDSLRLLSKYHDRREYSMCRIVLAPCSPYFATRSLLEQTLQLARRHEVHCHTHLAESKDEEELCLKKTGMRPLEYMGKMGWLGKDIWFAQGIYLNDEDLALLAATGTGISHCPASNQWLSLGTAKVPQMLTLRVPVGLGAGASNGNANMLAEMKEALRQAQLTWGVNSLTPRDVLTLATRGGARLLGREDIGSLAPGKAADFFLVNAVSLGEMSCSDPVTALVTYGPKATVDTTVVNGKITVRGGHLLTLDEGEIARRGNEVARELLAKAGIG